jgi:hypothetical protein
MTHAIIKPLTVNVFKTSCELLFHGYTYWLYGRRKQIVTQKIIFLKKQPTFVFQSSY